MPEQKLKVSMPTDLDPVFANLILVVDNGSEFIFDFAQALPNTERANIKVRIVLTAINAKRFHASLGKHIAQFEGQYQEIIIHDDLSSQLFGKAEEGG